MESWFLVYLRETGEGEGGEEGVGMDVFLSGGGKRESYANNI